jgi:hypothetical protein
MLVLAAAVPLFAPWLPSACSSVRTVTTSEVRSAGPAAPVGDAGGAVTGKTVTKEVPHSSETVSEIQEREVEEPQPARGDMAMPPHRIRPGDNAATTPPPVRLPAGAGE